MGRALTEMIAALAEMLRGKPEALAGFPYMKRRFPYMKWGNTKMQGANLALICSWGPERGLRDASDEAVMILSFPTEEALIAALFPYLMPRATTKAKRMVVHRAAGA